MVRKALATLSKEQRQVIEIAYYTGLSHSQIAAQLGQPRYGKDPYPNWARDPSDPTWSSTGRCILGFDPQGHSSVSKYGGSCLDGTGN